MAEIEVSSRAYSKIILHAAKYPHCAVNGILVAEKTKSKESKHVKFTDCFPLFHISINLTPMLEVALLQIDTYCKSRDLVIAGYYQANEHYADVVPSTVTYRIADKIRENNPDSYIFMVDNRKMTEDCDRVVYNVYESHDGKWKLLSDLHTVGDDVLEMTSLLLQTKYAECLVDFDNHLDDISLDWKNKQINSQIEHIV